jgi:hypothetical protein
MLYISRSHGKVEIEQGSVIRGGQRFSDRYSYNVLSFLIPPATLLRQLDHRRKAAHQGFVPILTVLSFSRYGVENMSSTKRAPADVEKEKVDLICERRIAGEKGELAIWRSGGMLR